MFIQRGVLAMGLFPKRFAFILVLGALLASLSLCVPLIQSTNAGSALGASNALPSNEETSDFVIHLPLAMRNFASVLTPPVLEAIDNGDGDGNYTVGWSAPERATTYTLQEADSADFSGASTAYAGAATSTELSGRAAGTYFYRVRAASAEGESAWSNVQSAQVTAGFACPATGQWSGTTNQGPDSRVTFEVQDSPYCRIPESDLGANPRFGFSIRFWDNCGTERNIANLDEIPIANKLFELSASEGIFRGEFTAYTRANGTFSYNNGGCTASGTWTAELPPPGAFSKTSPANEATVRPPGASLTWGASAQAERYEYCYDTTPDHACTNWVNTGTTRSASIAGLSPSTTYYWQVRAANNAGTTYANGDATADWSFTTNNGAPGDFVKSSPADGASGLTPNRLILDWGDSSYAEAYAYCYDTTDDDACTNWVEAGANSQAVVTGLEANATIYWQVRAENSYGVTYADGAATAYRSFQTGDGLPGAFNKAYPLNGAPHVSTSDLTLDWGNSNYADSYAYCYDTTDDDTCTQWIDAGDTSEAILSELADITTFYWQVRATNNYGDTYANGAATSYWSFTTQNDLTGAWTQQTSSAEWAARYGHTTVLLPDGSLVLMGGYDGSDYFGDVWRSTNQGITWTQMTAAAEWSARYRHASVMLSDGSIVLMGGYDGSDYCNDVWRSTDKGATWTQMTAAAGWAGREGLAAVALSDDSIILMGGLSGGGTLWNDVWRSSDQGATWSLVAGHAPWAARVGHATVLMPDGSLVLMGGFGYDGSVASRRRDVWRSTNQGVSWVQMTASAAWAARESPTSVVLPDGSIILMGGYASAGYQNDVWRSKDYGATWVQLTAASWAARTVHTSVTLADGSIVVLGGVDHSGAFHDVWRFVKNE